jgi:hypothetical protein
MSLVDDGPDSYGCGSGFDVIDAVNSEQVVCFLSSTHRFRGEGDAQVWFGRALDPESSIALVDWLSQSDFPEGGINSQTEYDLWRHQNESRWMTVLAQPLF